MTDTAATAGEKRSRGLVRLVLGCATLAILVCVAMLAVLVFIPDSNDYAKAARLKEQRLRQLPGNRIVLIGGSNLAFGIDSHLMETLSGCAVVNMGMNGYLGVRYMLEEAKAGLRKGDVAVIALEYDNFVKAVDGAPFDLLWIAKTNPGAMRYMTARQRFDVVASIPPAVRAKVNRLADVAVQRIYTGVAGEGGAGDDSQELILGVESLAGFNQSGDLVSHLDVQWPYQREQGLDLTALPVDPELSPLLRDFAEQMRSEGVDVVLSYTPLIREFYLQHRDAIARIDSLVRAELDGIASVPSPPESFVYDGDRFFDTVYHVNRIGRESRSTHLANDIIRRSPGAMQCRGPFTIRDEAINGSTNRAFQHREDRGENPE